MAKQGKVTRDYANTLKSNGWNIAYTCIPNTVHIGVVPIPTSKSSSSQRYPDIVAYKDGVLLLVEIEVTLNKSICDDISLRFSEMNESLMDEQILNGWVKLVRGFVNFSITDVNKILNELVVVNEIKSTSIKYKENLEKLKIKVVSSSEI